jgi:hypothetical protein
VLAKIDHWFDSENMTHLQDSLSLVPGIVGNIGGCMEQSANSMSAVRSHDRAFVLSGNLIDSHTKITVECARTGHVDSRTQTIVSGFNKLVINKLNTKKNQKGYRQKLLYIPLTFRPSESTFPTKKVSFKSAWNPL